jgi:hypothetical protein
MSRFDDEDYQVALASPPDGRWRVAGKREKGLWTIWHMPGLLLGSILGFFCLTLACVVCLSIVTRQRTNLHAAIGLGSVVGVIVVTIIGGLYCHFASNKQRAVMLGRDPMTPEAFVTATPQLRGIDMRCIEAALDALGFAYCCDPRIIRPTDDPKSLYALASPAPYGFEVVLGAASRLGIVLSEEETDNIIHQVRRKCSNVAEIICVLVEELSQKIDR